MYFVYLYQIAENLKKASTREVPIVHIRIKQSKENKFTN